VYSQQALTDWVTSMLMKSVQGFDRAAKWSSKATSTNRGGILKQVLEPVTVYITTRQCSPTERLRYRIDKDENNSGQQQ
jgi:hypothetical protein